MWMQQQLQLHKRMPLPPPQIDGGLPTFQGSGLQMLVPPAQSTIPDGRLRMLQVQLPTPLPTPVPQIGGGSAGNNGCNGGNADLRLIVWEEPTAATLTMMRSPEDLAEAIWLIATSASRTDAAGRALDSEKTDDLYRRAKKMAKAYPNVSELVAIAAAWKGITENKDCQNKNTQASQHGHCNFAATVIGTLPGATTTDRGTWSTRKGDKAALIAAGVDADGKTSSNPSIAVIPAQKDKPAVVVGTATAANKDIACDCNIAVGLGEAAYETAASGNDQETVFGLHFVTTTNSRNVKRSTAIERRLNATSGNGKEFKPHQLRSAVENGAKVAMTFHDPYGCVHVKRLVLEKN